MNITTDYLRLISRRVLGAIEDAARPEPHPDAAKWREFHIESFAHWVESNCVRAVPFADALVVSATSELTNLQDSFTETLTMPWPHVEGKPRDYFPRPCAEVTGQTLRLWFDANGVTVWERRVSLDPAE